MYQVSFSVKLTERNDPNYGLLIDKRVEFPTFGAAASFSRELSVRLTGRESLVGRPCIQEAA